jgi:predicted site-specific integrase-resolvase
MSDEPLELEELMTPKEVMEALKVTRSTVQRMSDLGYLGEPIVLMDGKHKLLRYRKAGIIARTQRNSFKVRGVRKAKKVS